MKQPLDVDLTGGVYRRIYAGFLVGRRINAVSLQSEAWFWRLHAIADDHGNLPGEAMVVKSLASPRRDIPLKQCEAMTDELVLAGLVIRYKADGDNYLHLPDFEEKQPAGRNGRRIQRVPLRVSGILGNPGESKIIQDYPGESSASDSDSDSYSYSDSKTLPAPASPDAVRPPARRRPKREWSSSFVATIYDAVWKKVNRAAAWRAISAAGVRLADERFGNDDARAFEWLLGRTVTYAGSSLVRTTEPRYQPHPATWFNKGGYDDDDRVWDRSAAGENPNETSFEKMLRENANGQAIRGGSGGVFGEVVSSVEDHAGTRRLVDGSNHSIPGVG